MSRPWPSTFWGDSMLPNEVCPSTSSPSLIEDTGRVWASLTWWELNSLERDELKAEWDPLLLLLPEWLSVQAWEELSLMLFPFCPSNSILTNCAAPSDIFLPLFCCTILWFCWCLHFSCFPHSVHADAGGLSDSEEPWWACCCWSPKLETLDDFLMPRLLTKSPFAESVTLLSKCD